MDNVGDELRVCIGRPARRWIRRQKVWHMKLRQWFPLRDGADRVEGGRMAPSKEKDFWLEKAGAPATQLATPSRSAGKPDRDPDNHSG